MPLASWGRPPGPFLLPPHPTQHGADLTGQNLRSSLFSGGRRRGRSNHPRIWIQKAVILSCLDTRKIKQSTVCSCRTQSLLPPDAPWRPTHAFDVWSKPGGRTPTFSLRRALRSDPWVWGLHCDPGCEGFALSLVCSCLGRSEGPGGTILSLRHWSGGQSLIAHWGPLAQKPVQTTD